MIALDMINSSTPATIRPTAASAWLPGRTKAETKMFVSNTTLTSIGKIPSQILLGQDAFLPSLAAPVALNALVLLLQVFSMR